MFSQGSWIVKQSVGKKACLVGQALEVHYFRGKNYLEVDYLIIIRGMLVVDIFSSDYQTLSILLVEKYLLY